MIVLQEIREIIRDESRLDHSQFDAFILFIMSHGSNGYVYGIDDESVSIDDDIGSVLGRCRSLKNKPKLIFFSGLQRCVNLSASMAHLLVFMHCLILDILDIY